MTGPGDQGTDRMDIDIEALIEELFEGRELASSRLRELREALATRWSLYAEQVRAGLVDPNAPELREELQRLRQQLDTLAEEEAIAEFVETALLATLGHEEWKRRLEEEDGGAW